MSENMQYLSDKDYKYVYSRVPRLCVDLVIKYNYGVLLSKRLISPNEGKWHLPGGRVKYKETIETASKRIALNETGVRIDGLELLGYMEFPKDGEYVHSVSLVFYAKGEGEIKGSEQGEEIQPFSEIPSETYPEHKVFLEQNWGKISKKLLSK